MCCEASVPAQLGRALVRDKAGVLVSPVHVGRQRLCRGSEQGPGQETAMPMLLAAMLHPLGPWELQGAPGLRVRVWALVRLCPC